MSGACFFSLSKSHLRVVAVAVGRRGRSLHASIMYRDSSSVVQVMDLRLDGSVVARPVNGDVDAAGDVWAVPNYPEGILRQVAAFCESVGKSPRRLTYAFKFDQSCHLMLVDDGVSIEGGEGLTCATFVLAIFHQLRLRLLDTSTWQLEPEDEQFQNFAVALMTRLKKRGELEISDEDLEKRRKEIPCIRFSPLDVIGGCRSGSYPVSFSDCRRIGKECLKWMDDANLCHDPA